MEKRSWCDLPRGNVPWQDAVGAGGWRQKGRKVEGADQGDLSVKESKRWSPNNDPGTAETTRAGVRASIVAMKGL